MTIKSKFSSMVAEARDRLDLTQAQVAEAVDISVRWYQEIENGKSTPGFTTGIRLMTLFGLSVKDLEEVAGVLPIVDR